MTNGFLWLKALHIVFVTSWFAGLFYLPRIFVNLAMVNEQDGAEPYSGMTERGRLLLMARKLYRFMGPLMVLALLSGSWLWLGYGVGSASLWLPLKLVIVAGLVAYHLGCGATLRSFERGDNKHSHVWYRWFNEVPVLALFVAVVLVVVKPF